MNIETWRVLLETGEICTVLAAMHNESARAWLPENPRNIHYGDDRIREVVVKVAAHERWAVSEILAPGQLSSAEKAEAATLAERKRCGKICEGVIEAYGEDSARMAEGAEICRDFILRDPNKCIECDAPSVPCETDSTPMCAKCREEADAEAAFEGLDDDEPDGDSNDEEDGYE